MPARVTVASRGPKAGFNGSRLGNGRTRCGAVRVSSTWRSRALSKARPKAPDAR